MSHPLPSVSLAGARPLTCLLVHNEPQAAQALADCVRRLPSLALVGVCTSPDQAGAQLQAQPVDVLFLNMELPLLTGLALLQSLGPATAVVLTSPYPDYGLQDYHYGVVEYLVTPISFSCFSLLAGRLVRRSKQAHLATLATTPCRTDGLYFWVDAQLVQVRLASVLFLEELPMGCRIKTVHGEFTTSQPFSVLADQLPEPQFLRVHSSFVVALRQARPVAGNALAIGDQRIPVGPALEDELLARAFQTNLWGG